MALSSLEIGKRGLLASKVALDVTGNNIANVNTPGFSRRVATSAETDPQTSNGMFVGTGVIVDKIKNYREEFFDKDIRTTTSRQSGFDSDTNILNRIQGLLAEPSNLGLNESVTSFLNSFQDLITAPEDTSLRQNVLMQAQSLVDRFHSVSGQISGLKSQIAQSTSQNVDKANSLIKEIAGLNGDVQKAIAYDGVGAQSYVDAREQKLEELSKIMDVTVTNGTYGTLNVFVNGINIITGTDASQLKLNQKVNSQTGEQILQVVKTNPKNQDTAIKIQDGELGSQLKNFNQTLNAHTTSGGFSISKQLNDFVSSLADKINSLTSTAYGLNDTTAPAAGRKFFDSATGTIDATTIELSGDVKNNPENIPLSANPGEPGDSTIARQITNISIDKSFLNNQTPSEYYTNTLGQLGQLTQNAQNGSQTTATVAEQLNNQRDSIIGVNLDEEAVNLVKYQKAFEASSRVVNIANSILTTIVALGR